MEMIDLFINEDLSKCNFELVAIRDKRNLTFYAPFTADEIKSVAENTQDWRPLFAIKE